MSFRSFQSLRSPLAVDRISFLSLRGLSQWQSSLTFLFCGQQAVRGANVGYIGDRAPGFTGQPLPTPPCMAFSKACHVSEPQSPDLRTGWCGDQQGCTQLSRTQQALGTKPS